jgi:hypothetical protein
MEPQSTSCEHEDDSIPFGLRITIGPISGKPLEGIRSISGGEPFPFSSDLPSIGHLGRIVVTPAARASLDNCDVSFALSCHLRDESKQGRPGRSSLPDPQALQGCRILGAYRSGHGQTFWIITEADRRRTTVLMPKEYISRDCS